MKLFPLEVVCKILALCKNYSFLLRHVCSEWRELLPKQSIENFTKNLFYCGYLDIIRHYEIYPRKTLVYKALEGAQKHVINWSCQHGYMHNHDVVYHICNKRGKTLERLEILKSILFSGIKFSVVLYLHAVKYDHEEIWKWLMKCGYPSDGRLCSLLLAKGQDISEALSLGHDLSQEDAVLDACTFGNTEALTWLKENKYYFSSNVFCLALKDGHLQVFQWATDNGFEVDFSQVQAPIHEEKTWQCITWSLENGHPYHERISYQLALHSQEEKLDWLRKKGYPLAKSIHRAIIQSGNLDMYKKYFPIAKTEHISLAIDYGHAEMVEWLTRDVDIKAINLQKDRAIRSGSVKMAKFLHAKGVEFMGISFESVLKSGSFDMVEWVMENGFVSDIFIFAKDFSNLSGEKERILDYIFTKISPKQEYIDTIYYAHSGYSSIDFLRWLEKKGYFPSTKTLLKCLQKSLYCNDVHEHLLQISLVN